MSKSFLARLCIFAISVIAILPTTVGAASIAHAADDGFVVEEFIVGILTDQSGQRSADDEPILVAIQIAADEINRYLEDVNSPVRLRLQAVDTGADPERTITLFYDLIEQGIRVFLGPTTSAELAALKPHADKEYAFIVSPSSTAPSLSTMGDLIFRFTTDDSLQALALSRLMYEDGIQALVPLTRNDVYGTELAHVVQETFAAHGGYVAPGLSYDPHTANFDDIIRQLSPQVEAAINSYGADAVALHLIAFNESVEIFHAALHDPVLSSVRWYGSDGTARSRAIVDDALATEFALKTQFTASVAGLDWDAVGQLFYLADRYYARFNTLPDAYAVAAYDALWVMLHSYLATRNSTDTTTFAKAFTQTASTYYGAGGWTGLNPAGDRMTGHYDFWTVMEGSSPTGTRRDWGLTARYVLSMASGERIERVD